MVDFHGAILKSGRQPLAAVQKGSAQIFVSDASNREMWEGRGLEFFVRYQNGIIVSLRPFFVVFVSDASNREMGRVGDWWAEGGEG
jgi:hypothetical protein